ncbi:adenylyltransferase/sulfurtransferase [Arcticibacter tournemirensis]|uniref:Molybdopterin-synthase adenylyltransferase n=1 Tax=Arcticibacter tournemirensis TaxID=699437 RepID=A0A5M9HHC9_9SPHI|nr:HesA/MoeB/ThiF family protein [Arcticibacter tournemirensis]KAA8485863.1 hypothetical protein F1649_02365 [Arcticibacter tournemirensis]TQM46887.1 adenylyltransferase/sulfurtransferase [Arcticibacter tournemirensis]
MDNAKFKMNDDDTRYTRQIRLKGFGPAAQDKLKAASVLVVGAGGLGIPVLQYMVGMGIGRIVIADGDRISVSNLQRQVLYSTPEVGQLKAEVAAKKLAELNPLVKIEWHPWMLTPENALSLIEAVDLVVDATDNFASRYLINDACVIAGKPFIYGAVQQYEGQLSVFNYQGGPTYRCLYPEQPSPGEVPDCNEAGVLGIVPGIVGSLQALEAVKVITGIGRTLSGSLKIVDFLSGNEYKVRLKASPENQNIDRLRDSYEFACQTVNDLSPQNLHEWYLEGKKFLLVDVRETFEYESGHLMHAFSVPLAQLNKFEMELPANVPLVTFCQMGGRSLKAAEILQQRKNTKVYNLRGGMESWMSHFNDEFIEY